ncbi:MAG: putative Ig domain-containing protein [Verrucomicrobia bacterium]|nr:putative Ig domain-containing protein [Verrucomicrobiota bacterium]
MLQLIGDKVVSTGRLLTFTAMASNTNPQSPRLIFSLDQGAPTGASINPATGVFTWTPTNAQGPSTNRVTIRVTDDSAQKLTDSETIAIIVTADDIVTPPRVRLAPISDRTANEGSLVILAAVLTNSPTAIPPLSYSLAPGAPANAVFNATTGAFFWQTREEDGPSTNTITVRVGDSGSPPATASQSFTVVVNEVNRAPVLAAIDRKTIGVGARLTFQALATDDDLPANALTYSLELGAPVGAAIDLKTGVFTWTPTQADAQTAHTITIRVADNGSPALSDSKTFTVVVGAPEPLKLFASILPNGQFQLTVNGEIGKSYFILRSTDLSSPDWELLTNFVATATSVQILDPTPANSKQRFYRAVSP